MTRDNDDSLLRSVALQNAESIHVVRLRAEQQAEAALREQANLLNLTHDAIFVRDIRCRPLGRRACADQEGRQPGCRRQPLVFAA